MCLVVDQSLKSEDDEVVMTLKTKQKTTTEKKRPSGSCYRDAISWFVWYLSCLFMSFCEMESPCVFKRLGGDQYVRINRISKKTWKK